MSALVPAATPRRWLAGQSLLGTGSPPALQNVSLGDVFALSPRPAVLDGQGTDDITLADFDFSHSSLGDIVSVAYALGNGVTLPELSGALRTTCSILSFRLVHLSTRRIARRRASSRSACCAHLSATHLSGIRPSATHPWATRPSGDTPLGDTPLGDTPLGDTPLGDTPLGDTPLGDTPLGDTPLGDTDLNRAPLGDTPLGDTPLGDTNLERAPLGDTPLGDTPLGDTPLGDTPLGDTPISGLEVQSCTRSSSPARRVLRRSTSTSGNCSPRLDRRLRRRADARRTGEPDTLRSRREPRRPERIHRRELLAVLDPPVNYTLAQVAAIFTEASGVTLADLVASLPNSNGFTLNDLLPAFLRAGASGSASTSPSLRSPPSRPAAERST